MGALFLSFVFILNDREQEIAEQKAADFDVTALTSTKLKTLPFVSQLIKTYLMVFNAVCLLSLVTVEMKAARTAKKHQA
jgi:hypothetical protein